MGGGEVDAAHRLGRGGVAHLDRIAPRSAVAARAPQDRDLGVGAVAAVGERTDGQGRGAVVGDVDVRLGLVVVVVAGIEVRGLPAEVHAVAHGDRRRLAGVATRPGEHPPSVASAP